MFPPEIELADKGKMEGKERVRRKPSQLITKLPFLQRSFKFELLDVSFQV